MAKEPMYVSCMLECFWVSVEGARKKEAKNRVGEKPFWALENMYRTEIIMA